MQARLPQGRARRGGLGQGEEERERVEAVGGKVMVSSKCRRERRQRRYIVFQRLWRRFVLIPFDGAVANIDPSLFGDAGATLERWILAPTTGRLAPSLRQPPSSPDHRPTGSCSCSPSHFSSHSPAFSFNPPTEKTAINVGDGIKIVSGIKICCQERSRPRNPMQH